MSFTPHRSRIARRTSLCVLPLLMVLTAQSAVAQAPTDDAATIATARALAVAGVQLSDAGRCDEAILKLQRAEEIHHAPVVLYHLGACHIRLGRLVQGSEVLRNLLREPAPAQPNPAVEDALRRAASLLDETSPKIATLTVLVDAPPGAASQVRLDGQDLPSVLLGVARAIDPGEHAVDASAPGCTAATQRLLIAPGQTRVVAIALKSSIVGDANAAAGGTADDAPGERTAPVGAVAADRAPSMLRRVPAYIAWGVGAAALFVGAGYGYAALHGSSELDARCPQGVCPPDAHARLASERTHATISTIAFAVAAAGAMTGTVLYWTTREPRDDVRPKPTAARPQSSANLRVGLGGVAVGLEF